MSPNSWPIIISADDFGRSPEINQAIFLAHQKGVLSSASIMVTGEAFDDAVTLARQMPNLAVGLHLVLCDGRSALPHQQIPHLVDPKNRFATDPARAGLRYFFTRSARKELAAEIEAQLQRFLATGLRLSHVDGHQHLHLHPTVLKILLPLMKKYDVHALRVAVDDLPLALRFDRRNLLARSSRVIAMNILSRYATFKAHRAGMFTLPRTYGLAQTGRMNRDYLLHLLEQLKSPAEIYLHPTTGPPHRRARPQSRRTFRAPRSAGAQCASRPRSSPDKLPRLTNTMTILAIILSVFILASWSFWITALICARLFFNYKAQISNSPQPVSILKPVRGVDSQAYENFATYCRQNYPKYEILFGVSDPEDPAIDVIKKLQRNFPECKISLHLCPRIGMNDKSSILHELADRAQYPILAASDSDIRVTPDYLAQITAPLQDEKVGLVTCLYRSEVLGKFPAKLEALYLNSYFAPAAIVGAHTPGTIFGFGAAMAMRKRDLDQIGGYAAIVDYVSDDYHLAAKLASLGLKIKLSEYIVTNEVSADSIRDQLLRELRWSRMIRTSNPWGYRSLLLTFSTPLSLLLVAIAGAAPWSLAVLGFSLLFRWTVAWSFLTMFRARRADLYLLPLRDCIQAMVWAVGLFGQHIFWRGRVMNIRPDGRAAPARPALLSRLWMQIDAYLRKKQGVHEFSNDPTCLLRYSVIKAERDLELIDGTAIRQGEEILDLHFWNEHFSKLTTQGRQLISAPAMRQQMTLSLEQLASFLESEPSLAHIRAIHGRTVMVPRRGLPQFRRIVEFFHFEIHDPHRTLLKKIHDFFEDFHILGLMLAFNPWHWRNKPFHRQRHEVWISRSTLMTNYAPAKPITLRPPAKAAS